MSKETEFLIFCMENYKVYRALTGRQVLQLFTQYDVMQYIREFYDVLHTTGAQYINHDIDQYLAVRGATLPRA